MDSGTYGWTITALKRLASAVRFRPWPPRFQQLTDYLSSKSVPFRSNSILEACRSLPLSVWKDAGERCLQHQGVSSSCRSGARSRTAGAIRARSEGAGGPQSFEYRAHLRGRGIGRRPWAGDGVGAWSPLLMGTGAATGDALPRALFAAQAIAVYSKLGSQNGNLG